MEYNTQQPKLIISEYGRNIQKMVDFACTVTDREERNKVARAIIDVMGALNPHLRDVPDFKHKLWDHIFIISNFKLEVDSPYPKPSPEILTSKPNKVPYPQGNIRFRHYGKNVETLIQKAIDTENQEQRNEFTQVLANHMKKSYLNWNRDSVGDEVIIDQLDKLSRGKLKLKDEFRLNNTQDILSRNKPKKEEKENNRPHHKKDKYKNFKHKH